MKYEDDKKGEKMKYEDTLKILYSTYPRQISVPKRRNVNSINEFMEMINKYLNVKGKRFFVSLYNYTYENTKKIDLPFIFFDFDALIEFNRNKKKRVCPFELVQKMYHYVKINNLKSLFVFSGKGFHAYIFTKNGNNLLNPKNALRNSQLSTLRDAGLMIEYEGIKYPMVDKKIIGDIARVATVPGTKNWKRGRWSNFICEKDFEKGYEFIKERAKNNRFGVFKIIGNKLLDLKPFDEMKPIELPQQLDFDEEEISIIEKSKILSAVPPCIAHLLLELKTLSSSYRERFIVIAYFISQGFNQKEIENVLKEFLCEEKFKHCIKQERQINYLYQKNVVNLSCTSMKLEGYCVENCKRKWLDE